MGGEAEPKYESPKVNYDVSNEAAERSRETEEKLKAEAEKARPSAEAKKDTIEAIRDRLEKASAQSQESSPREQREPTAAGSTHLASAGLREHGKNSMLKRTQRQLSS